MRKLMKLSSFSVVCVERDSTTKKTWTYTFQSTQKIWNSLVKSAARDLLRNIPLHVMQPYIRIYVLIVGIAPSFTTQKKSLLNIGVDTMDKDTPHSVENSLTSGLEGVKNTKQYARHVMYRRCWNKRETFLAWIEPTNCLCVMNKLHCCFM